MTVGSTSPLSIRRSTRSTEISVVQNRQNSMIREAFVASNHGLILVKRVAVEVLTYILCSSLTEPI
jgi:hypothetical protein